MKGDFGGELVKGAATGTWAFGGKAFGSLEGTAGVFWEEFLEGVEIGTGAVGCRVGAVLVPLE